MAWDCDQDVVERIPSPAFHLPRPDLIGRALIPPPVLRACNWGWETECFSARDITIRRYTNVFIANQGLIVREPDRAIYVSSVSQHTSDDQKLGLRELEAALDAGDVPTVSGPCVLCLKPGGDNYGHWLNEMLPRAHMVRRLGLKDARYVVPPAEPALAEVISTSLAMIGIGAEAILPAAGPMRFEELYNVVGLTQHGIYMSPLALDCLDEIAGAVDPGPHERLYVSRGDAARRFANEPQVCEAMAGAGFHVVTPGDLRFADQVALFKGAGLVAGCMGAGMANIGFSPRGAEVSTFAPAGMPDTFYWFLAGHRGQPYREVRCPVSDQRPGKQPWDRDLLLDADAAVAYARRD